jgi:hypothetical protein
MPIVIFDNGLLGGAGIPTAGAAAPPALLFEVCVEHAATPMAINPINNHVLSTRISFPPPLQ